jgi:mono/diheme cytochrome c family protein
VGAVTPTATPDVPDNGGGSLAIGKDVYDKTAGGIGCAYCHKADATGDPVFGSPNIQNVTADQIWDALETGALMTFITLTEEEVQAVATYLGTIGSQP